MLGLLGLLGLLGALGLLGLLGLLGGVLCFLALLQGGLNHVVSHARRSDRPADFYRFSWIAALLGLLGLLEGLVYWLCWKQDWAC